jgi:polyhydroxybutyrate depolymerase
MIMNGTEDPLVPFDGGDVNLFGVFVKRGKVLAPQGLTTTFLIS